MMENSREGVEVFTLFPVNWGKNEFQLWTLKSLKNILFLTVVFL